MFFNARTMDLIFGDNYHLIEEVCVLVDLTKRPLKELVGQVAMHTIKKTSKDFTRKEAKEEVGKVNGEIIERDAKDHGGIMVEKIVKEGVGDIARKRIGGFNW
jgi:hypothetical protein